MSGSYIAIILLSISLLIVLTLYLTRMRGFSHSYLKGILALVDGIEAKDPHTRGHSERVSGYATIIAREMGFGRRVKLVTNAALVHDIGKVSLPEGVLTQKGALEPLQQAAMMGHPVLSYEILERFGAPKELLLSVRHHHEWYGGGGYPDGLSGEDIPLIARILCVADSFEAMTSGRSFRARLSLEEAKEELIRCRGTQFDPRVVDAFVRAIDRGEVPIRAPEEPAPAGEMKTPLARIELPWTQGMLTSTQYKAATILFRLGQEIRAVLDLSTTVRRVLSILSEVTGYQNYAIFLRNDNGELVMEAEIGCRSGYEGEKIQEGVISWVAQFEVARLIPDVAADPGYLESSYLGMGSMLCAPLSVEGRVVGVLVMESDVAYAFTSEDLHLIEALTPYIATIIEVAQLHRKARLEAIYDSLTGVYNHRYFYERLREELARSRRYGLPLSMVILDIDGMKRVNDIYGHLAGDQALGMIGRILKQNTRASDIVARYGGDEFTIIMLETAKEQALEFIHRVTDILDKTTIYYHGMAFPMPSRSYGVVTFPHDGSDAVELFAAADHLLYEAKERGRGVA